AQALRAAAEAAPDGGAGFDTAHHDQPYPALRQFADRTKQEGAGRFFSGPADGNTPHAEELARGTENSRMFRVSRRRTGRNFWIRA
ncbi:TPA: hypothetical protein ACKLZG_001827, partial [Neisseria gonorrhoeae]